jgi:hypothetical protein
MTKEIRLIFLAALTLVFYALSIYLSEGALIFPFPLNEAILFIVALQFAYWNRKNAKLSLLIVVIGLFSFLGNEVYWSFILGDQQMHQFSESIATDIFQLIAAFSLLVFAFLTLKEQKNKIAQLFTVIFILIFMGSISYLSPSFVFLGLCFMATSIIINPVLKPFHLIWIALLILESTKFLTLLINI